MRERGQQQGVSVAARAEPLCGCQRAGLLRASKLPSRAGQAWLQAGQGGPPLGCLSLDIRPASFCRPASNARCWMVAVAAGVLGVGVSILTAVRVSQYCKSMRWEGWAHAHIAGCEGGRGATAQLEGEKACSRPMRMPPSAHKRPGYHTQARRAGSPPLRGRQFLQHGRERQRARQCWVRPNQAAQQCQARVQ